MYIYHCIDSVDICTIQCNTFPIDICTIQCNAFPICCIDCIDMK